MTGQEWYHKRLGSTKWAELREECFDRDGYMCRDCGVQRRDAGGLQAHHTSYDRIDTEFEIDDLITLCRYCHAQEHARLRGENPFADAGPFHAHIDCWLAWGRGDKQVRPMNDVCAELYRDASPEELLWDMVN